jgi:hypothetical protein
LHLGRALPARPRFDSSLSVVNRLHQEISMIRTGVREMTPISLPDERDLGPVPRATGGKVAAQPRGEGQAVLADSRGVWGYGHTGLQWNQRYPDGTAVNWGGYAGADQGGVFADCDDPSVTVRWSDLRALDARGNVVRPEAVRVSYQDYEAGECPNTDVMVDETGGMLQVTNTPRSAKDGTLLRLPST